MITISEPRNIRSQTKEQANKQENQDKNKQTRSTEREERMTKKDQEQTPAENSKDSSKEELSEIEQLRKDINEKTESFLRLQAEFANYKRRTEEQNAKTYSQAVGDVLKKFIGVFDDFELALKATSNPEDFRKGIELIFAKFVSTAEEFGLKKIDAEGQSFDPQIHEALLTEETDDKDQVILEELQSGYKLNDTVLRTAKVKVSRPKQ